MKQIDQKQSELKTTLKEAKNDQEKEKIRSIMAKNENLKSNIEKNIKEQIEKDQESVR